MNDTRSGRVRFFFSFFITNIIRIVLIQNNNFDLQAVDQIGNPARTVPNSFSIRLH